MDPGGGGDGDGDLGVEGMVDDEVDPGGEEVD